MSVEMLLAQDLQIKPKISISDDRSSTFASKDGASKLLTPSSRRASQPKTTATTTEATTTTGTTMDDSGYFRYLHPTSLHPRIEAILYWRNVRQSSAVFVAGLSLFMAISRYNVVGVLSYLALIGLTTCIALKMYSKVLGKGCIITNWTKTEKMHEIVTDTVKVTVTLMIQLRDLFLVKSVYKTVQFGVVLYAWTYIGACISGLTLVVGVFVGLFIVPKACELLWPQYTIVKEKFNQILLKIESKINFWKRYM